MRRLAACPVGDIELQRIHRQALLAQAGGGLAPLVGVAAGQHDLPARLRQLPRDFQSDAAIGAGYHGDA